MIICGIDERADSSAAVAYAVWLGQQLRLPLRLFPAEPSEQLLAAAETHHARLLIVACGDSDSVIDPEKSVIDPENGTLALIQDSPRPVVALSKRALAPWRTPHRAQRAVRPFIIAGIDGSKASLAAAAEAADLTERMDSWLLLVHARPDPVPHGATWFLADDPLAEGENAICERLALRILPALGREDGALGARDLFGDPAETLCAAASAETAAMVAVGTRGLEADRLALGGSVSAALARDASCPVMILSPRAVARTIRRLGARDRESPEPRSHTGTLPRHRAACTLAGTGRLITTERKGAGNAR